MSYKHGIIRLRRGTAAEWAASQPQPGGEVLRLGEPGYEKDTGKLKIGDGVTPWNSLVYFNAGATIDPEDIEDILGDGFLVAGTGIEIHYDDLGNSLTISTSGVSFDGHNHVSTDITDSTSFGRNILTASSYAAQNKLGWQEITTSFTASAGGQYFVKRDTGAIGASGLLVTISDPSGLSSPGDSYIVVCYGGRPINVGGINYGLDSSNSGIILHRTFGYRPGSFPEPLTVAEWSTIVFNNHNHTASQITDFNSSVSGLLPVKDIVGGTDISISSTSGIYTINSSNSVNTDTKEPDGFVNRSDSTISFDDSSRIFTIAPTGVSYSIYNNGVKVVKSSSESVTLPDTTALYYIHFDKSDNSLSYKTTAYNFITDIPIAHIYYNADDNKAVYFGEERHGIVMDSATHKYLHTVFGTQYINGLSISNYITSGDGSLDSDATIAIGDGLIYDEDIDVNITHSDTPSNPFEQVLYPVAVIPVYYKVGSSGVWTDSTATNFPVKVDTTIQYNLNSAGTWSASNSDAPNNNRFIASWICATSQEHAPIIAIMGQRIDSSLEQATSNNSWGDLNLNGLPVVELRPLYRLIYDTKSSFANGAKGFLVNVLDIRSHIDTITGLPQNDHGNLYGLADDDHYQYVHIDEARTIDAVHTFTNGLISNDNITISGINVSLDGHQHVSTDITNFNSSVSGLLPTIANSGNNRILTSDGTSYGINAENNLTFDNLLLEINCQCPSGNAGLKVIGDNKPATIFIEAHDDDILDKIPRLIFKKTGGSATNPTVPITDATLFSVRGDSIDSSGNNQVLSRIRSQIVTPASGVQNSSTSIKFEVSSTSGTLDNSLQLLSDGSLINSGPFSATSGSFTSLNVNGIAVSVSGHTHTSSNITDFNSSVSGLFPAFPYILDENFNILPTNGSNTVSIDTGSSVVGGGDNNTLDGIKCVIGGGGDNTSTGAYTTIGGGQGNTTNAGYATVGGGGDNTASYYCVVAGGRQNLADIEYAAICGGYKNQAQAFSFVGGGYDNTVSSLHGVIGGGYKNNIELTGEFSVIGAGKYNTVSGSYAVVGGGKNNNAQSYASTISGGDTNTASAYFSAIGGGESNIASGYDSVIGGGRNNSASSYYSVICGGNVNNVSNIGSFIGGGSSNTNSGYHGVICGGINNIASGDYSIVVGGNSNSVSDNYCVVGGGYQNTVEGPYAGISAGSYNSIPIGSDHAFIGGGKNNTASTPYSVVCGGRYNTATDEGFVGGGSHNTASAMYATVIGGGNYNSATNVYASICGGNNNTASGPLSSIGGGGSNTASAYYSTVGGGNNNNASSYYSVVSGGQYNTASSSHSTVSGGRNNNAISLYSTVNGGYSNNASAIGSTVSGGLQAKADRYGMQAYSVGRFASNGDAQRVNFILRRITADGTPTELFLDSNSVRLTIPSGKALFATVSIAGIINGGSKAIHYIRKVAIKNISGTTSLIGTVSTLGTDVEDDASYDVSIAADDTNDALQINVTGKTGETIRWVAHVDGIEIAYG